MSPTLQLGDVAVPLLSAAPLPLLGVVAAGLLYARAVSILRTRGRTVPRLQVACWYTGLALVLVGTQTFIDPVGEHALLSLHMLQHLLIADLPAPLLLVGLRAPVLYFFWPRPVLVGAARCGLLRATWRVLRRPPVALGTWLAVLYAWHLPVMYEAALGSPLVHDLEHLSFVVAGVLAWWPVFDPTHERVQSRAWKVLYVIGARAVGGLIGAVLLGWPSQVYASYGDRSLAYGLDPLLDQQVAGFMMMVVDTVAMTALGGWLLWRMIGDAERDPDLIVDPALERRRAEYLAARDAARQDASAQADDRPAEPAVPR